MPVALVEDPNPMLIRHGETKTSEHIERAWRGVVLGRVTPGHVVAVRQTTEVVRDDRGRLSGALDVRVGSCAFPPDPSKNTVAAVDFSTPPEAMHRPARTDPR